MNMRSIAATWLAVCFTLPLVAQDTCPREKAENVPAGLLEGPAQGCGSFGYDVGGVHVASEDANCPLFVVYTPPHQRAVPSTLRTQVANVGTVPITKVVFKCVTRWFLFIPIGSACAFSHQLNLGAVQLLTTQACPSPLP